MPALPTLARFRRAGGTVIALMLILSLLLSACAAPAAPADAPAAEGDAAADADAYVTVFGETLPEDAVPYDRSFPLT